MSLWDFLSFDKAAHAFTYIVFTLLWANTFSKQSKTILFKTHPASAAFFIGLAYGILIEILQGALFIDRSAEVLDVIANSIGGLIGWGLFNLTNKKR
ncbi:MAG: VanZ family protein [Bacteroidetes bacterium]|nr:VanZ family protein [Bacteroidota bacterium]